MSSGPQKLTTDEYLRQFHHITPNHHSYEAIRESLNKANHAMQQASPNSSREESIDTGLNSMEIGKKGLGQTYTTQAQGMYRDYLDKCDPLDWKNGSELKQESVLDKMDTKETLEQISPEADTASTPLKTDGSPLEKQLVGGEFRFVDTAPKNNSDPIGVPNADHLAKNIDEVHTFVQPEEQRPTELGGHGAPDATIGQMAPKPNVFESSPNHELEPTPSSPVSMLSEDNSLRMQLNLQGAKNEFSRPHSSPTSQFTGMVHDHIHDNGHLYARPNNLLDTSMDRPSPSMKSSLENDETLLPSAPQPENNTRARRMQQHLAL
ncbi:MAG: hypothetical protein RBT70_01345 [Alphaproteobacteria bacterium]|jgi:hypothetical protein|nr:hypothetical protein [Alphaproteobacteria bacterium]